jgi:hypothetical protein
MNWKCDRCKKLYDRYKGAFIQYKETYIGCKDFILCRYCEEDFQKCIQEFIQPERSKREDSKFIPNSKDKYYIPEDGPIECATCLRPPCNMCN